MSTGAARVVIGMPVYNGGRHVAEAIESILGQKFTDLQLVISDNASTDATGDICSDFARRDPRIKYIRLKRNIGASRNWNLVAQYATGPYFKWASANDICSPELLTRFTSVLDDRRDVAVCYSWTRFIDDRGECVGEDRSALGLEGDDARERFVNVLIKMDFNNAQNGLIRSSALRRTRLEGVFPGGDIPLMAELALHGKYVQIPEYLFFRRMSHGAASTFLGRGDLAQLIYGDGRPRIGGLVLLRESASLVRRVMNAPVSPSDKLWLTQFIFKLAYWKVTRPACA